MAFKQAERTRLWLRCALFGPSGSGKTMTALRMAKGIAEKMGGKIAVIDTEARSASKYADRISFDVNDLPRKTVDDYIAAMKEAAAAGYKVLVIDSLSHAWRELTEEVDRLTQASNSKNSLLSWGKVSPKQKRLVEAVLNFPGHIIATMRSKTEWVIGEGRNGKTAPEKLGLAPEQGKGIEYEFDLLVEINQQHHAVVTKDRTGKFQDETIEKPGEEFGAALYDWLSGGSVGMPSVPAVPAPVAENPPAKSQKAASGVKPKPEKPAGVPPETDFKDQGDGVIQEIGKIITSAAKDGGGYFSEDEKEEARQIIRQTRLDERGIADLREFKIFLSDELTKREAKTAA
jgi:nucleoside-triphosphatase THEP1